MAKKTWAYIPDKSPVKKGLSGEDIYYKKLRKCIENADDDRVLYKAKKRVEKAQSIRQVPQPAPVTPQKDLMLKSAEKLENVLGEMNGNPVMFENEFKEFKINLAKSIESLPLGNAMHLAIMKARIINSVSMYSLKNDIAAIVKSLKQLPAPSEQYSNLVSRNKA